jgi:hypothetical protein
MCAKRSKLEFCFDVDFVNTIKQINIKIKRNSGNGCFYLSYDGFSKKYVISGTQTIRLPAVSYFEIYRSRDCIGEISVFNIEFVFHDNTVQSDNVNFQQVIKRDMGVVRNPKLHKQILKRLQWYVRF